MGRLSLTKFMEEHLNYNSSDSLGFCLLPSELIQTILPNLALPEIVGLKLVNKTLATVISDQSFMRECNMRSNSASWLFVFKKRWSKDATLMGFIDKSMSNRWFEISIAKILEPVVSPGEVLYFLTASGNTFLFACNKNKEAIAVDLMAKRVKKVPPSPLGPRGTSSWRRSGMKLVPGGPPGSGCFHFSFAELAEERPTLFEYDSGTDDWKTAEAEEIEGRSQSRGEGLEGRVFLHLVDGSQSSAIVSCGSESLNPSVLRGSDSTEETIEGGEPNARLGWDHAVDLMRAYGDGHLMIIKSNGGDAAGKRTGFLERIELRGLSEDGRDWEFASEIPRNLTGQIGKFDSKMKGSNLAGVSFSTGLNL